MTDSNRSRGSASLVALGACLFGAVLATAPGAAVAQSVSLTYATNTAPNNLRGIAEKMFLDELAAQSDGAIEIVPYWGSSLMDGDEILTGVRDGVADMGFVNINYYPNRMGLNSAFNLFREGPVAYEDKMSAFRTAYEEIPALEQELADENQRIIYLYAVMPYAGAFTSDVTSLDDFEGKRIRASSRWSLNMLGGVGATPVSVPWPDVYQALQTGSIEGCFTNLDGIHRANQDEVAPNIYIMEQHWVATPFILTMNTSVWDSLAPEIKEHFNAAWDAAQEKFAGEYATMFDEIVAEQKEAGYDVTFATDEEAQRFASLPEVEENRETWVQEASDAGIENAQETLEQLGAIIDENIQR